MGGGGGGTPYDGLYGEAPQEPFSGFSYIKGKRENVGKCKNICGTQFSRCLFSALSYMVNYVYYLVCLCLGIFGVFKSILHTVI